MLKESQLRWSLHIGRMTDYRLPKRVFFGELCSGDRSRGIPRRRYKDTLKVALKRGEIEPESCEHVAQDRATWRNLIKQSVSKYEQEFIDQNVDKRRRRKERLAGPPNDGQSFSCPHCGCSIRAKIVVVSHLRTHTELSLTFLFFLLN